MTSFAVRLDRLQAGLIAWARASVPAATVVWGQSGFPETGTAPLVIAIRILNGPTAATLGGESRTPSMLPTSATVRINDAPVGGSCFLRASGWRWDYEVQPGDDAVAVRDGLLAAIGPTPLVSCAFAAAGASDILITPDSLGDLYGLAVRGSETMIEVADETLVPVYVQAGDVQTTIEIQAWATSRYANGSAQNALSQFSGARKLPAAQGVLATYGLGVIGAMPAPIDLTSLSGPTWQSRAALTFDVCQVTMMAEPRDTVERVYGTLVARAPDATVTIDTEDPPA